MRIAISDAQAQLADLVHRAEAGEEIILTHDGKSAVRLSPVRTFPDAKERLALIEKLAASASARATPGPGAARSQDFLYGDDGLPE